MSHWRHDNIRPGSVIDVAAPRGDFYLSDGVGPVVLLSAGVGITPVLAMLHALADRRSDREIWWLHTTRDAHTHAFVQEVTDLVAELPNAESACSTRAPSADWTTGRSPHSAYRRTPPSTCAGRTNSWPTCALP